MIYECRASRNSAYCSAICKSYVTSGQHGVQQKQQQKKQQNDLDKPVQDGGQHNQKKQKQNETKDGGRTLAGDGGHELEAKVPKEEARTNKIKNNNQKQTNKCEDGASRMPASRLPRLPCQEGGEALSLERGPAKSWR